MNGTIQPVIERTLETAPLLGCFFCGVDSKALVLFFIIFACCLVLAALSFLGWAFMRGDFKDVEGPKFDMLDEDPPIQNEVEQQKTPSH